MWNISGSRPRQAWNCPGKILVNCAYCLPRTILSCGMMGQTRLTVRTTDQSKAQWLGGRTGFFSTHKLKAHVACVACPDNLAALKPPLMWKNTRHSPSWQCSCVEKPVLRLRKDYTICVWKNSCIAFFGCVTIPQPWSSQSCTLLQSKCKHVI